VAGSANNQLATPDAGVMLAERGILYAPDFVINAGGVISVAAEYLDLVADDGRAWIRDRINSIPDRLTTLFDIAALQGQSTEQVARAMAREVLAGSKQNLHCQTLRCRR
jgi:leucine dehydrogenase